MCVSFANHLELGTLKCLYKHIDSSGPCCVQHIKLREKIKFGEGQLIKDWAYYSDFLRKKSQENTLIYSFIVLSREHLKNVIVTNSICIVLIKIKGIPNNSVWVFVFSQPNTTSYRQILIIVIDTALNIWWDRLAVSVHCHGLLNITVAIAVNNVFGEYLLPCNMSFKCRRYSSPMWLLPAKDTGSG